VCEIFVTAAPFVLLWALAWWSVDVNCALAAALSVLNAGSLARLVKIRHDCGHGSFFRGRRVSDRIGRVIGGVTSKAGDLSPSPRPARSDPRGDHRLQNPFSSV
jgi:omega-6 fatty acid desaturase (delta-12 desaturase)